MRPAIVTQNVGKVFVRHHPKRPTTLVERLAQTFQPPKPAARHWALREVTFTVEPGRMLGVIGANGAGKSTLLRLLGGVGRPDEGHVQVYGRIGALLDLGAGFHPDLTGRENVFVSGVIAGLTRREVAARFDEIVAFAELAEHIDDPLRTYSTGMQMRLAFAIATHITPEILLIDEVLAVGDIAFQQKCLERINQFKAQGCTIVLVTHDPGLVQRMCDEAIWLRAGRIAAAGTAEVVTRQYLAEMSTASHLTMPRLTPLAQTRSGIELKINENRFGTQELEITDVTLLNQSSEAVTLVSSGEPLIIQISYRATQPIESPIFGATLAREDGVVCYESSTAAVGVHLPTITGTGYVTLYIDRLDLIAGQYYLDVGSYPRDWAYAYDYHWRAYPLRVHSTLTGKGLLQPPHYWHVNQ